MTWCRVKYEFVKFECLLLRAVGRLDAREYDIRRLRLKETYCFKTVPGPEDGIQGPETWGNEHQGLRFLVIRRSGTRCGLFSHFITNLGWVKFAEENGMVPVIDMSTRQNLYSQATCGNPWELFFSQPAGYGLKDIQRANCVYVSGEMPPDRPDDRMCSLLKACPTVWHDLAKRYFRASEAVQDEVMRYERVLFGGSRKVLGVLVRGTDYVALKPPGHPVQPEIGMAIRDVNAAFDVGGYDFIFLVTEDEAVSERFRQEFGNRLRMTDQQLPTYRSGGLLGDSSKEWGSYRTAFDYCVRILLLSRCKSIIAGRTSGAVAAAILSDGFDAATYWDLGRYAYPPSEGRS